MGYVFTEMTEAVARDVLSWRYDPPYDMYDADPAHEREHLATLLDPANKYFVAYGAEGQIAGYCCFGPDARVAGGARGVRAGRRGLQLPQKPRAVQRGVRAGRRGPHSGMFPCFFGGRVSRLPRRARRALTSCTRVADGGITEST